MPSIRDESRFFAAADVAVSSAGATAASLAGFVVAATVEDDVGGAWAYACFTTSGEGFASRALTELAAAIFIVPAWCAQESCAGLEQGLQTAFECLAQPCHRAMPPDEDT